MNRVIACLLLLLPGYFCPVFSQNQPGQISLAVDVLQGQVYQKTGSGELFSLLSGTGVFPVSTSILTGNDGVVFVKPTKDTEFRLREDSSLNAIFSSTFVVRKGIVGVKVASDSILIETPHTNMRLSNCIAVIKVNSLLSRICVIRGKAILRHGKRSLEEVILPAGFEIAASSGKISAAYPYNDELRYAWYWTTPALEPSLQP